MSHWLHRIGLVFGGVALGVSLFVPMAAPLLGTTGVKLLALSGALSWLGTNAGKLKNAVDMVQAAVAEPEKKP